MTITTIHPQAWLAIRAAYMRNTVGTYASRKYAMNNGVLRLYVIACQLAAMKGE